MNQTKLIKIISASLFSLFITACSNLQQEKSQPLLEVYPTNMNDCAPVMDTEYYINVDCKRRSVNRLTDDVEYLNEPSLVTMQGFSMMESIMRICDNLTTKEKAALNHLNERAFKKIIINNYDFDKNPEFEKEFTLISKKLKGKYDHDVKEKDCKIAKEIAKKEITEKYKLK